MLENGRTLIGVYPIGQGRVAMMMLKRSTYGGVTLGEPLQNRKLESPAGSGSRDPPPTRRTPRSNSRQLSVGGCPHAQDRRELHRACTGPQVL